MNQPESCTCPTTALLSTGHLPGCPCAAGGDGMPAMAEKHSSGNLRALAEGIVGALRASIDVTAESWAEADRLERAMSQLNTAHDSAEVFGVYRSRGYATGGIIHTPLTSAADSYIDPVSMPPVRVEPHLAVVRISREALACLLLPPDGKAVRFRGVPEGAVLLCVRDDFSRGSIEVMFQHPSFAAVHPGEELPCIDVTVELVDIATEKS